MSHRAPSYQKYDPADMARSICATTLLHLLLLFIACSATPSFVVTGAQTRFDLVWATGRSLVSDHAAAKTAMDSPTTRQPVAEPTARAGKASSAAQPAPADSTIDVVLLSAVDPPGASPARAATAPRTPRPRPVTPHPAHAAHRQALPKKAQIASVVVAPPVELPQAITVAVAAPDDAGISGETDADDGGDEKQSEPPEANSAHLLPPPKALPAPRPSPQAKVPAPQSVSQSPAGSRQPLRQVAEMPPKPNLRETAGKAPGKPEAAKSAVGKEHAVAAVAARRTRTPAEVPPLKKPALTKPSQEIAVTTANSVPSARGAIVKALQGDLKLVIEGDSGIKLSISFREYPKARRSRISRSEARRDRAVAPAFAATREDTREAVIETAQDGIYTFRAASEGGKGARANFVLKIYEAGLRRRTANLGVRTISGSTVLFKILMPEAVLWDDESAFTGSMEDSESETKFNATTGLYWKEYRD